jgi:integrase
VKWPRDGSDPADALIECSGHFRGEAAWCSCAPSRRRHPGGDRGYDRNRSPFITPPVAGVRNCSASCMQNRGPPDHSPPSPAPLRPHLLIQAWLRGLQADLAPTYVRVIFTNVSSVFEVAVDDGLLARNPCRAGAVKTPRLVPRRVEPCPAERVMAVVQAMPTRYRAADKTPRKSTCRRPTDERKDAGRPASRRSPTSLPRIFNAKRRAATGWSSRAESADRSTATFQLVRLEADATKAAVDPSRANGMHALRHVYAPVQIDAGESVKAVAEYLGHADPGFTLRVYAHLFTASDDRSPSRR